MSGVGTAKILHNLVDRTTFAKVQLRLAGRASQVIHPREVDSPYLLFS